MSLHKIKDFDPDYRNHFDNENFLGFDLYSGNEKVGSVDDLLVDESGSFRYLVVKTGIWVFGKRVLLPIGRTRISYPDRRVYADNLSQSQVESLPEFDENSTVDYEHEENVRNTYRPGMTASNNASVDNAATMGSTPLDQPVNTERTAQTATYDRDTYSYDRDPALYDLNERDHQNVRLYEERLIANKTRQKTGEVAVGKRVETEASRVSVPIDKERIVIERTAQADIGTPVDSSSADFREGEVARMEVYEEVADIHKETVVRENISIRKEVDHDTVEVEEQLRREELDVDTQGRSIVDKRMNQSSKPGR